jgi:hypothetical protein
MPKYYRVDQDDFEALPFYSDMDEGWEGHALIVEEQFKEEFIAEQIARFTRHLLSILHEMPTRGEVNPYKRIGKQYERGHDLWEGEAVICPNCNEAITEDVWNENTDDMRPCCPVCEYEFEMEEEEE